MNQVEQLDSLINKCNLLKKEIAKVIVGQKDIVNQILISILSSGHCLLVGVPGLAKTLLVNTIAKTLGLTYKRIQFTPDLMPSDIIGSEILNTNRELEFIKGPLFANILLADEINRRAAAFPAAALFGTVLCINLQTRNARVPRESVRARVAPPGAALERVHYTTPAVNAAL